MPQQGLKCTVTMSISGHTQKQQNGENGWRGFSALKPPQTDERERERERDNNKHLRYTSATCTTKAICFVRHKTNVVTLFLTTMLHVLVARLRVAVLLFAYSTVK